MPQSYVYNGNGIPIAYDRYKSKECYQIVNTGYKIIL